MTRWQEMVVQELREQAEAHLEASEALREAADAIAGPQPKTATDLYIEQLLANEACERAAVTLKEAHDG